MKGHPQEPASYSIYTTLVVIVLLTCFLTIFCSLSAEPLANASLSSGYTNKSTKLRPKLEKKLKQHQREGNTRSSLSNESKSQWILVDAIAKGDPDTLLSDLKDLGMQSHSLNGRVVSGLIPLSALENMDALDSLNEMKHSHIITSQGSATSKGDQSQQSDLARQNFRVDGSGVTIGVMSDSYNCLGGESLDKQTDDLPEQALSVEEALDCAGKNDEGRALMQIIHDIAPAARLVFHSADNGLASAANGILDLAFIHQVDIIVEDFKSSSANYFQEGPVSQAVDRVVKAGVIHVTAAGNSGRNSYQNNYNEYIDTAVQVNAHDFDPGDGVDIYQRIHVPEGLGFNLLFQWDSSAYSISGEPGSRTDLDIYILDETHSKVLASSTFGNIGRDPVELVQFFNPSGSGQTKFDIMITKVSGEAPSLLKYIILNSVDGIIQEYNTESSGIFGHANLNAALTVGAANYLETPVFGVSPPLLQSYSSAGGTPWMLDSNGVALSNPSIPEKPDVVAPDNVNTTFFKGEDTDGDGKPNMSGTSAAAPHVAGVVALLLESNPKLQPVDIKKILQDTSIDIFQRNNASEIITGSGFDFDSGYGLVNAEAAVDLSKSFQASNPETGDWDTGEIIVNDPNQNGGGMLNPFFIVTFLINMIIAKSLMHKAPKIWPGIVK